MNEHDRFAPLAVDELAATASVAAPHDETDADLIAPVPDAWARDVLEGQSPTVFLPRDCGVFGLANLCWPYRDAQGRLLGAALRWNTATGKEIRFATLRRNASGKSGWKLKHLPAPRPLYGLDRLAADPAAPVVVVEGEKAADTAARIFPKSVATTSPAGAMAAAKTDWSPLRGRRALHQGRLRRAAGARLRNLDRRRGGALGVTGAAAQGWDAADAVGVGHDLEALRALALDYASPIGEPIAAEPFLAGTAVQEDWKVSLVRADSLKMEPIRWLWRDWLAGARCTSSPDNPAREKQRSR